MLRRIFGADTSEPSDAADVDAISFADFVTALYRAALNREPDPEGLEHYVAMLRDGADADEVVRAIARSPEAANALVRSPVLAAVREQHWRAADEAGPARPLFFLHIMKTGGTSLTNGLQRLVSPGPCLTELFLDQLVALPSYVLEHMAFITGHLPYEALDLLPRDVVTCTVIREPVERTLSHYWHLHIDPMVRAERPDFSLEEFVASPRWYSQVTNYQARHLGHRIGLARAWVDYSPRQRFGQLGPPYPPDHPLPLQSLFDCTPLAPNDELEREALAHLDSIELVGVTDELDALVAKVVRALGAAAPPALSRDNPSQERPRASDVPDWILDKIRETNRVDAALYERALERSRQS